MIIEWRNGFLSAGTDYVRRGWSIQLCWNRREDLGDDPEPGEIMYADEKRLTWYRGKWRPRYYSYAMKLIT